MSFLTNWLRRVTGAGDLAQPVAPPDPIQVIRATYTIDLRTAGRVYLMQESRWRSAVAGLTGYHDDVPIGAGRVERLQSSLGRADQVGAAAGQVQIRIALPNPLPAGAEATQILSTILTDPFPADHPSLTLRPTHPTEAIGLTIIFPVTRPARDFTIRRTDQPEPVPPPAAPQATPRADGRLAYVWLQESPPPGAAYELSWTWEGP